MPSEVRYDWIPTNGGSPHVHGLLRGFTHSETFLAKHVNTGASQPKSLGRLDSCLCCFFPLVTVQVAAVGLT